MRDLEGLSQALHRLSALGPQGHPLGRSWRVLRSTTVPTGCGTPAPAETNDRGSLLDSAVACAVGLLRPEEQLDPLQVYSGN